MLKSQNTPSQNSAPALSRAKYLILSYFLMAFVIVGCRESNTDQASKKESAQTTESDQTATQNSSKTILFFGDSITAGYGLDDKDDAFPGLIQERIDSLNMNYQVINSGVSGETTAGGKSRINWVMNQDVDIFILELGANDGLRGVPLSETRANLQSIIDTVQEKSPDTQIILAGMQLPPNMGQEYTTEFRELFYDITENNDIEFIPFILKDVGGIQALNQSDGIHPTEEGHAIIAETVWETLEPLVSN